MNSGDAEDVLPASDFSVESTLHVLVGILEVVSLEIGAMDIPIRKRRRQTSRVKCTIHRRSYDRLALKIKINTNISNSLVDQR